MSFSGSEWTASTLFVLITTALAIVCVFLKRDNERLRRSNWELEGAVGQPPGTAASWLPRAALASFLLPCLGSFAVAPFFILVQAQEAAAQLRTVTLKPPAKAHVTPKEPPPVIQLSSTKERLHDSGCESLPPSRLWSHLAAVAEKERVSADLLEAVIFRESYFHPCAVSSSGALGLMQLMPGTAADLGVQDPFDPQQNIEGGARFLGRLMVRYHGDVELALAAYHAGPARVDAHGAVPPIPTTRTYVNDVVRLAGLKLESDFLERNTVWDGAQGRATHPVWPNR